MTCPNQGSPPVPGDVYVKSRLGQVDWRREWHACHHSPSHHYGTQQSHHTMLIIMGNGFLWGGGKGGEEAAPCEAGPALRPWGWPRFKIGFAG